MSNIPSSQTTCNQKSTLPSSIPDSVTLQTFDPLALRERLPLEIQGLRQWVVWKLLQRDGRATKIPVNPLTGRLASSTAPDTWATLDDALSAAASGRYSGIGLMFANGFCGVDLDKCRDPLTGAIDDWAMVIVETLDSYTEVSPSQTGLHIFARAELLGKGINRSVYGHKIEVYDRGRFFTVTGDHLAGTPTAIHERTIQVRGLYGYAIEESGRGKAPAPPAPPATPTEALTLDDARILELASQAKNGAKFRRLLEGDLSHYGGDDSRADLAFVSLLCFYTPDDEQVRRLWRGSKLYRQKLDRADYVARTLETARASQTACYGARSFTDPTLLDESLFASDRLPPVSGNAETDSCFASKGDNPESLRGSKMLPRSDSSQAALADKNRGSHRGSKMLPRSCDAGTDSQPVSKGDKLASHRGSILLPRSCDAEDAPSTAPLTDGKSASLSASLRGSKMPPRSETPTDSLRGGILLPLGETPTEEPEVDISELTEEEPYDPPLSDNPARERYLRQLARDVGLVLDACLILLRLLGFERNHSRILTALIAVGGDRLGVFRTYLSSLRQRYAQSGQAASEDTVRRDLKKLLAEQEERGVAIISYKPGWFDLEAKQGHPSRFQIYLVRYALLALSLALDMTPTGKVEARTLQQACVIIAQDIPRLPPGKPAVPAKRKPKRVKTIRELESRLYTQENALIEQMMYEGWSQSDVETEFEQIEMQRQKRIAETFRFSNRRPKRKEHPCQ